MWNTGRIILLLLTFASVLATGAAAQQLVAEARVESFSGEPVRDAFNFSGQGYADFVLRVTNGTAEGENRISSAVIRLNGVKVVDPSDFNQKVTTLERTIVAEDSDNLVTVELRSNPGGFLLLQVYGEPISTLPPDPGPEGDATLEGIDINGNGVRDDVERWIALNYPDSARIRHALTQMYYPTQNFMIHARAGDRDAVYDDMDALGRASECLHYIDPDKAHRLGKELQAVIVNTYERSLEYIESSRMLGGGTFGSAPYSKWKQSCTFNPDVLEN